MLLFLTLVQLEFSSFHQLHRDRCHRRDRLYLGRFSDHVDWKEETHGWDTNLTICRSRGKADACENRQTWKCCGNIIWCFRIFLISFWFSAAICFIAAAACCASLYWAEDANSVLGLSSVFVAMSSIGGATVTSVIVDNFPTYLRYISSNVSLFVSFAETCVGLWLIAKQEETCYARIWLSSVHVYFFCFRTMAVSITMMMGRIGAVIGNLLFPILFDLSCLGPIIMIGSASLSKKTTYPNATVKRLGENRFYHDACLFDSIYTSGWCITSENGTQRRTKGHSLTPIRTYVAHYLAPDWLKSTCFVFPISVLFRKGQLSMLSL